MLTLSKCYLCIDNQISNAESTKKGNSVAHFDWTGIDWSSSSLLERLHTFQWISKGCRVKHQPQVKIQNLQPHFPIFLLYLKTSTVSLRRERPLRMIGIVRIIYKSFKKDPKVQTAWYKNVTFHSYWFFLVS